MKRGPRTRFADQGPSKTVAFLRIPNKIFTSGTWNFRIIDRNIKAIFREYFSSLREDSGKIFKLMTFTRGPRTTYCIGDFGNSLNGFAKSPRVLRKVLNIEWVQFVLKNCEILHFVWGLYDKNSASYYCFTSDVMYKKYEMLVYTHPELLARFY